MVGQVDRKDEISKALKIHILRDREKQRLEDEAEAEKSRKKKEQDDKKLKEETEYKATKEKLTELTQKQELLIQEKIRIHEHLKKITSENNKYRSDVDETVKIYAVGGNGPHYGAVTTHQSTHPPSCITTSIPRNSSLSVSSQFKPATTVGLPAQGIQSQKRNRSPSPGMYRGGYPYKQPAGPHAFQKLEDPHRNHEYSRNYPYSKAGSVPPSGNYSAFYSPGQTVAYTHPSQVGHVNAAIYSSYSNRENSETLHKSHSPPGHPPSNPPPHSSFYATQRSSGSQQSNHIYHGKSNQAYADEKYYMVRSHVPVHSVIPIQPPQGVKHGSITSGYPMRQVATVHIQPPHGSHLSSQQAHHSSQSSHHGSQLSHHSSLPGHHSSSSQSLLQTAHSSHHPSASVHYSHHSQSQSPHSAQQPPSSVSSHHPSAHHIPQHPHHAPPSSHHQLLSHHSSSSLHRSSTQPHLPSSIHHGSHHPPQSLHHQSMQPHIQQHISSHQSQSQHHSAQQSQPTSVVTSQALNTSYQFSNKLMR